MKSSAVLLAAGALLATAMPLDKRALETQWVTDIVTVTVTVDPFASPSAQATAGGVFVQNVSEKPAASPSPDAPAPKPVYALPPVAASPKPETTQQAGLQPTNQAPAAPPPAAPKPIVTTVIVPAVQSPAPAPIPKPSPKPSPEQAPEPAPEPAPSPEVVAKPSPKPSPSPKPAASQPSPSSGGNDYQSAMLNEHNVHRANHSAPALAWDDTLAGFAHTTASGCVFAHDMTEGGGAVAYGQNLASWGTTGDLSGMQIESGRRGVSDQWYNDEMENWTFWDLLNPPSGSDLDAWGHFTQVVWKSSTKLGCATVQCPAGTVLSMPSWYTVCNYGPPGNFGGKYAENVLKPLGHAPVTV
ncbi:CAP domain-containing protein [Trichoderma ceciliae]